MRLAATGGTDLETIDTLYHIRADRAARNGGEERWACCTATRLRRTEQPQLRVRPLCLMLGNQTMTVRMLVVQRGVRSGVV